jgi:hypothetical protein
MTADEVKFPPPETVRKLLYLVKSEYYQDVHDANAELSHDLESVGGCPQGALC